MRMRLYIPFVPPRVLWGQASGQGEPVEADVHTLQTCADTSPGARPDERQ
jgi:hypothetical protein